MKRSKASRALFVGNGVNQLNGDSVSWGDLVQAIAKEAGVPNAIDNLAHKPFPLVFEAICAEASRKSPGFREIDLKRIVAEWVSQLHPNEYHREICNLDVEHIVTPNYDYSLELACERGNGTSSNTARENKYSLFRRRLAGEKNIWHMHGEAGSPWSICLGHDHYSGYLAKLRNEVHAWYRAEEEDPVETRLGRLVGLGETMSWWQLFGSGRIDIVGFGCDYTEIDLWWLLGWRARQLAKPHRDREFKSEVVFHQFVGDSGISERETGRMQILKSLGVQVNQVRFNGNDYRTAYDEWLQQYDHLV